MPFFLGKLPPLVAIAIFLAKNHFVFLLCCCSTVAESRLYVERGLKGASPVKKGVSNRVHRSRPIRPHPLGIYGKFTFPPILSMAACKEGMNQLLPLGNFPFFLVFVFPYLPGTFPCSLAGGYIPFEDTDCFDKTCGIALGDS